jgi:hypothetical protein
MRSGSGGRRLSSPSLNSDTVVTQNWLDSMLRWMEIDPTIGMVGPCTNFASGQQIEVNYRNLKGDARVRCKVVRPTFRDGLGNCSAHQFLRADAPQRH